LGAGEKDTYRSRLRSSLGAYSETWLQETKRPKKGVAEQRSGSPEVITSFILADSDSDKSFVSIVLVVATLLLDAAHDDDALILIAANILPGPAIVP
jgi:hypothetical protein